MKDNTRVTLMVCIADNGEKSYCCFWEIEKSTLFFNKDVALTYTQKNNAWFNKIINKWCIEDFLIPYHFKYRDRGVPCYLILDNCTAHNLTSA